MKFNGINMAEYFRIVEVRGRGIFEGELSLLSVPHMDGAHPQGKKRPPRVLEIKINVEAPNREQLLKKIEKVNEILNVSDPVPIVFPDENDRVYYGIPVRGSEEGSLPFRHRSTLTIICPDPDKFSDVLTGSFPTDNVTMNNLGTAPAKPVFHLTAKTASTFALVRNQEDKYMMIGSPTSAGEETFVRERLVMRDTCSTLTGWTLADAVDNGPITGQMIAQNGALTAQSFGSPVTPKRWQGPSMKRSIGGAVQNFKFMAFVELVNVRRGMGMLEIYLKDAGNNIVAKIGIEDIFQGLDEIQGKFQLGNLNNRHQYYRTADVKSAWNNFKGLLQIFRDNGRIRPYFSLIDGNGRHIWTSSAYFYTDTQQKYQAPVTQVQVAMRSYAPFSEQAPIIRVDELRMYEYLEQEGVPYIVQPGDVVTFDHEIDEILINGESRMDLIMPGADFFTLAKGSNEIGVYPFDTFDTSIEYKERFV